MKNNLEKFGFGPSGATVLVSLLGSWLCAAGARGAEPFDVAAPGPSAKDSMILQGEYTAPASSAAPVLVFLHGLGSSRNEWGPLLERAHQKGWGTLAYDLRGHGHSRATVSGFPVNFEDPANGRRGAFWAQFPMDLQCVLAALQKKQGVSLSKIVLIGASVGANISLVVASGTPELKGVVLLSPGLDYAGIKTEEPMVGLGVRALLVAAEPDLYAFTSSQRLCALAPIGRAAWWPLARGTAQGAHGAQLFDGQLERKILDWIGGASFP